ncbi:MAG: hypothetical protein V7723_13710 [Sneathiella sp.]|uniref:hypothetical protein n=1 Tax=Sneathiella sp. TaxID=1964365 RepID=UPI003001E1BC
MPSTTESSETAPDTTSQNAKIQNSASFAMSLLYQFAAHSSGLSLENATINSNLLNSVSSSGAAALVALKNAEAIAISAQRSTINESYNAQTATITQALNAQTEAAVTSLNAVTSAGGTALAAQTSQEIAGITADAVAATAVAMDKIVKQMGG